ncbi:MAG TPA: Asp23/Gls24 family envelope stress response protein [Roseiflexaceae bacterium]|nr:Asp23/Gls24 family envelope stress response protein [Roseiflexaceae bacterium]
MTQAADNVIVAPNVLARLIGMAVREVPGVARLASVPRANLLYATTETGVAVRPTDEGVIADCYLIAAPETNLLEVGTAVQATIAAVIQDLAGMVAREVNVYIQDVETSNG